MDSSATEQSVGEQHNISQQANLGRKSDDSEVATTQVSNNIQGADERLYSVAASSDEAEVTRFKMQLQALIGGPLQRYRAQLEAINSPLATVIADFDQFARTYFEFFLQNMNAVDMNQSGRSRSHDLSSALGRLQRQAETLSRASEQRQIPEFEKPLTDADKQATQLYTQFTGYKRDQKAIPITYFEKIFGISRMLYTAYPLISIPLLSSNDSSQWKCGLAHELGHYIYWNSTSLELYREVRPRLQSAVIQALGISNKEYNTFKVDVKMADLWVNWLEETFADVCATLLVGHVYAASSQRLMEDLVANLTVDDSDHPLPYLRPLIPIEVMAWVAKQSNAAAVRADLEDLVGYYRQRWAQMQSSVKDKIHLRSGLDVDIITEKLSIVVRTILDGRTPSNPDGLWVQGEKNDPADIGHLIDYTPWLQTLHEPAQALPLIDDTVLSSSSPSFQELLSYLRTKYPSEEQAVRQALLLLELDNNEGEIAGWQWVIEVAMGEGNYRRV